jgi:hypothetical protein
MPDDGLFDDQPAETSEGAGSAAPTAPQAPAASQLAGVLESLHTSINQTNARLSSMEQEREQRQQQVAEPEPETGADPYSGLYTDPGNFIRGKVKEELGTLSPFFASTMKGLASISIDKVKTSITEEFSDEAWTDIVEPALSRIASQKGFNPATLTDSANVEALVSGIIGLAIRDPEKRGKLMGGAAKAKSRREPPVMLSGGKTQRPVNRLTPDEQNFVTSLKRTFPDWTPERYMAARNRGRTESDWKPAAKGASK